MQFALEIFLAIFASWTLSYELALLVRIPAVATIIPWALLLIPIVWYLIGTRRQRCEASTSKGALLAVSAVALLAGAFTLFVHRPDPDDLTFFHRALDQKWCEPFLTGDDTLNVTRLNVRPLPEESILHSMCSYEPLITLAARALKRNPLAAYQIGAPFLIAVALVYVYFLGYRTLGIGEWPAAGAALAACTFLVLDGNNHGSFGNMSLDRLWQGKCVVFTLLIP
ncbi:MAG TPA: hypothetical protein VEZ90_12470, partial [Blastocatellia bacterium]|nr:hypothetical protein [Blastocatellia bacterium]